MKNKPHGKREKTTLENVEKRFWEKVKKTKECWNWIGWKQSSGHGQFQTIEKVDGAHRFSWILHFGQIIEGMYVLHKCDNGSCVNPKHLFLGTARDNILDMVKKGRAIHPIKTRAFGVKNGKYTHPEKTPRGSNHGNSVLTENKVKKIRKMFNKNIHTYKQVSEMFGVHKDTIKQVVKRLTWNHI